MYIQDTARYLEIIHHGLTRILLPQLQDEQSKAVAGILERALKELYKREVRTPALLVRSNLEGLAIAADMQALLADAGEDTVTAASELREIATLSERADATAFEPLRRINNRLNACLEALIARLASPLRERMSSADQRNRAVTLLRRAADWDYACSAAQRDAIEFRPFELGKPPAGTGIDVENLQHFVDARRPSEGLRVTSLKKIPGGMGKHTFALTLSRPDGTREELIIRKESPKPLVSRAAWRIPAEYLLLKTVAASGFNVPKPLLLAENESAFDADFFIMEKKPGIVPGSFFGPLIEIREELLLDLAAHMARLHSIPIERFSDYLMKYLSEEVLRGNVRTAYRLELEYWRRYVAENDLPASPALAYITDWMLANIPDNRDRPVLVHGDLNIHNFLVEGQQISAVLDWELALPGDPAQDIAYVKPNIEKYIAWDRFMDCYYAHGGRPIDESTFDYYIAFGNFRPLVVSLKNLAMLRDGRSDDVRLPYVDTDFVPQFIQNILTHIR